MTQRRVTQEIAEAAGSRTAPERRVSQEIAEAAGSRTSPERRGTQVLLEVAIVADPAYWDMMIEGDLD